MNLFDGIKRTAFNTTTSVMGYDCSWMPSDGSVEEPYTGRVHYKAPAVEEEFTELGSGVNQFGMMPQMHSAEYMVEVFPGLLSAVRNGQNEYVTITQFGTGTEIGKFQVRQANPIADGETVKLDLVLVSEIPQTKPTDDTYVP